MQDSNIDMKRLKKNVFSKFLLGIISFSLLFFISAGTLNYFEAWIYMFILFTPMIFIMFYLLKKDPALLERRLRMKEKEKKQSLLIKISILIFIIVFIIPGLDHRYNWSDVPLIIVLISDIIVFTSYIFFFFVLKENSYASRIIEINASQKVISSGPYSIVRHPMYLSASIMYLFTPVALGTYWGILATIPIPIILIFRIINEEKFLLKNLEGYKEYTQKVKYRIIPFFW